MSNDTDVGLPTNVNFIIPERFNISKMSPLNVLYVCIAELENMLLYGKNLFDNDISPEILCEISVERPVDKDVTLVILCEIAVDRPIDKELSPDNLIVDKELSTDNLRVDKDLSPEIRCEISVESPVDKDLSPEIRCEMSVESPIDKDVSPDNLCEISLERPVDKDTSPDNLIVDKESSAEMR